MVARISAVVCILAAAWTAYLYLHGGVDARILGVHVRSNDPFRVQMVAIAAGVIWLVSYGAGRVFAGVSSGAGDVVAGGVRTTAPLLSRLARIDDRLVVGAIAVALVVVGVKYGSKVAGGADSYGYVSEADLWLSGHLTVQQPWLWQIPWSGATWHFSPLGYRPALAPFDIVPKYSPGLPMLMAAAKAIGGQPAVFWVVPLSAGVMVLATFGIARRLGSSRAGMLAAWLLATSPIVLYMLVQPMSDIPVAAAWAVAFWCLLGSSTLSAAGAGLAVGLAILIRPNLVPLAVLPLVWLVVSAWRARTGGWGPALLRLAAFGAPSLSGVLATAALNTLWYGSPFRSGYESLDVLFAWSNFLPNLKNYLTWFAETQTPLALLGFVAYLLPRSRLWPAGVARGPVSVIGLFVFAVWAEYCAYIVFDAWWYLRFLLPCWPFLMIGLAVLLLQPIRAGHPMRSLAIIVVALAIGFHGLWRSQHNSTFDLQRGEDKYPTIARLVQRRTDANSVVLSMQHSGSLRYYGGRTTLAFYNLPRNMLDRAVRWLTERGVHSYAVLEDWEVTEFKERFGDENALGKLLMSPALVYHGASTIYLYDLWRPEASSDPVEAYVDLPSRPILCFSPVPLNTPTFKF